MSFEAIDDDGHPMITIHVAHHEPLKTVTLHLKGHLGKMGVIYMFYINRESGKILTIQHTRFQNVLFSLS